VTVAIVGISNHAGKLRPLFSITDDGTTIEKQTSNINAYLTAGRDIIVHKESSPIAALPKMIFGNKVVDGGHLRMTREQLEGLHLSKTDKLNLVRRIYGSADFIRGEIVYCLWIEDDKLKDAKNYPAVAAKIEAVRSLRRASPDKSFDFGRNRGIILGIFQGTRASISRNEACDEADHTAT
jgi:MmeI, target recognition domain